MTAPSSHPFGSGDLEEMRHLLCAFQVQMRDDVRRNRRGLGTDDLAKVAAVTEADTIYQIDRVTESGVLEWFDAHWPDRWPAALVMEGLDDHPARIVPAGAAGKEPYLRIIVDPIDGTRGLIHDKRSAWVLTGIAPDRGVATRLGDLMLAVMTEIPTTRQWRSDQVSAVRGGGMPAVQAETHDLVRGQVSPFCPRPSRAKDYNHGFASFARYFAEGKALLAGFEEALWQTMGRTAGEPMSIFEDQYISSGGQIYELMAGHDRLVGDLRPLAFRKLGIVNSLYCHPYDVCTALILEELGGVIVQPDGRPLDAPLNTTHPVSWVGFANPDLATTTLPFIQKLLPQFFGEE